MIAISLGDKQIPLPGLEPSDQLLYQRQCAELVVNLINRGDLQFTRESALTWKAQHPDNGTKFDAAKRLLAGYSLDEATLAFQHAYVQQINRTPEGRAAHLLVKGNVPRGWVLSGLDPVLAEALAR